MINCINIPMYKTCGSCANYSSNTKRETITIATELYDDEKTELYKDYLIFIEKNLLEEYNFDIKSYEHIFLKFFIKKDKKTYTEPTIIYLDGTEDILGTYEVMSYERWKKTLERDEKLSQFGI